eukprot:9035255-Lingulodinium_polyedra.AAC.1
MRQRATLRNNITQQRELNNRQQYATIGATNTLRNNVQSTKHHNAQRCARNRARQCAPMQRQ